MPLHHPRLPGLEGIPWVDPEPSAIAAPERAGTLKNHEAMRQDLLRLTYELAPIAICIVREEHIVFANRQFVALAGVQDSVALEGRSILALLTPASESAARQQMVQARGSAVGVSIADVAVVRPDGSARAVEIAARRAVDEQHVELHMVFVDCTHEQQQRLELESARQRLRRLSADLVAAREEERRRIARELHDELGQRLTALKMQLSSLAPSRRRAQDASIAAMMEMVDDTVASVRRIATDLRPLMLDDLGLNAAIDWLSKEAARRMDVKIELDLEEAALPVGDTAAIAIYRMVQEALTNVARHAHAKHVQIALRHKAGELILRIQDDGVGFSGESIYRPGSHGLIGILERADMLGGSLEVGRSPSGGACLTVSLPMDRIPADRGDGKPPRARRAKSTPQADPRSIGDSD